MMQHLQCLKISSIPQGSKPATLPVHSNNLSPLTDLEVASVGVIQRAFQPNARTQSLKWQPTLSIPVPAASSSSLLTTEAIILNLLMHPEFASPTVLRADVIEDSDDDLGHLEVTGAPSKLGYVGHFAGFIVGRRMLLRSIARNPRRDRGLEQTLWVLSDQSNEGGKLLVITVPHVSDTAIIPFFFPEVYALAFVVEDDTLSVHYLLPRPPLSEDHTSASSIGNSDLASSIACSKATSERNLRMARQLLILLSKHLSQPSYSRRVNHDLVVPREKYQTIYLRLKEKYGPRLCKLFTIEGTSKGGRETEKVFEEIGIASWLIGIWEDTYCPPFDDGKRSSNAPTAHSNDVAQTGLLKWNGFVDLGCGNGVLVDILNSEGWTGWGFDARERRSWKEFGDSTQGRLVEMVLIPYMLMSAVSLSELVESNHSDTHLPQIFTSPKIKLESVHSSVPIHSSNTKNEEENLKAIHCGVFPAGTFLISNHADELTAWTPLLGSLTHCPFLIIPCCSHNLSGEKFRATPRLTSGDRKNGKESTYQSLIGYVEAMCDAVQVVVEKEWLRIPSTRNVALLGRKYVQRGGETDEQHFEKREKTVKKIIEKEGGATGWMEIALDLRRKQLRSGQH